MPCIRTRFFYVRDTSVLIRVKFQEKMRRNTRTNIQIYKLEKLFLFPSELKINLVNNYIERNYIYKIRSG